MDKIRENYRADFQSKEMMVRQRAVALYFIDKLALRAGNEKDDDEADTVGCCSLRVEHISKSNVIWSLGYFWGLVVIFLLVEVIAANQRGRQRQKAGAPKNACLTI